MKEISSPEAPQTTQAFRRPSFLKRYWKAEVLVLILVILTIIALLILNNDAPDEESIDNNRELSKLESLDIPYCPSDLTGLLTASYVDVNEIAALTPLGNSGPPGHTFPVDHVYYTSFYLHGEIPKIEMYNPGDGIVTLVNAVTNYGQNNEIIGSSYAVTIALCKGVTVVAGGYTELLPEFINEVEKVQPDCKTGPAKHEGETAVKQCYYETRIPVEAGDQIGYTGGEDFPEVWAYDYRITPDPDVDWGRYGYYDYPFAFCMFDMYDGELKTQLFNKFGLYESGGDKLSKARFTPRTIEPICGVVNQDVKGTAQGDWFAEGASDGSEGTIGAEFSGQAISLIHSNFDPTQGRFSIGGTISDAMVVDFTPRNSGTINREFKEVTADGRIYCYPFENWATSGKILIQLIDDHNLKIEVQEDSTCGTQEIFINPYNFDR